MHLKLSGLRGRSVLDANAAIIGEVRAPLVDTETWLVDTLRIGVRRHAAGELGMMWSFFNRPAMDIPTGLIHVAGDAIILRVSMAELRESPPANVEAADAAIH